MKRPFQQVLRATRSPMNARRWLCELSCGHEQWLTAVLAPKKTHCDHCRTLALEAERNAKLLAELALGLQGLCAVVRWILSEHGPELDSKGVPVVVHESNIVELLHEGGKKP